MPPIPKGRSTQSTLERELRDLLVRMLRVAGVLRTGAPVSTPSLLHLAHKYLDRVEAVPDYLVPPLPGIDDDIPF